MKLKKFLTKLEKSEEFKKFKLEDPKSFLCSAFLVRDFEGTHNETQIDYYSPKTNKIVSFKIGNKIERMPVEKSPMMLDQKKFTPKKIEKDMNMDIENIKGIIEDEMKNRGITEKIKKLIVIGQNLNGKNNWNCTGFLDGLGLLQAHLEDERECVLFMEKKSFMDMLIPLKKGENLADAIKKKQEQAAEKDIEKTEGTNEGFIG